MEFPLWQFRVWNQGLEAFFVRKLLHLFLPRLLSAEINSWQSSSTKLLRSYWSSIWGRGYRRWVQESPALWLSTGMLFHTLLPCHLQGRACLAPVHPSLALLPSPTFPGACACLDSSCVILLFYEESRYCSQVQDTLPHLKASVLQFGGGVASQGKPKLSSDPEDMWAFVLSTSPAHLCSWFLE